MHVNDPPGALRPGRTYDLGERTFEFARDVRTLRKRLTRSISNLEDMKQLARSSGSVEANDIEANDALSRKDSKMHMRICRKEARESVNWLRLLDLGTSSEIAEMRNALVNEGGELVLFFRRSSEKAPPQMTKPDPD